MAKLYALGAILSGLMLFGAGEVAARQGSTGSVTGTVTYLQRIALPPNAEVTVQLVDVSRADAPATVINEQRFTSGGKQVPFPFTLTYDPAAIDQRLTYAVQATISVDGQLRFRNTQQYRVITQGNPTTVDVVVEPVGGGTGPGQGGTSPTLPGTGAENGGLLLVLVAALAIALGGAAVRQRAS